MPIWVFLPFDESALQLFESELKNMLIPFLEKNYRIKTGASNRALAGLSMGGIHTLYTGIKNTDQFSYLGVFSSGWILPMQRNIADAQYDFMKANVSIGKQSSEIILDRHGWKGRYRV